MLGAYLTVDGVATIALALQYRRAKTARWGWMLMNGILDLLLATAIIMLLPRHWRLAHRRHSRHRLGVCRNFPDRNRLVRQGAGFEALRLGLWGFVAKRAPISIVAQISADHTVLDRVLTDDFSNQESL